MNGATALAVAFAASASFGTAAVLQRAGARRLHDHPATGLGLFGRLLRRPAFTAGVVLDGLGVAGSLLAVRTLPVHVVEAILAASVAVAALLSAWLLGEGLGRRRWLALGALGAALTLVALTASAEPGGQLHGPAAAIPLALFPAALLAARGLRLVPRRWRAVCSGGLSGISFGMVALAGHFLVAPTSPLSVDDALFVTTVVAWLVLGLAMFGAGVRDGQVTPVIVGQTLGEAVLPSIVALAMSGELFHASLVLPGLGFAGAIVAAVSIARPAGVTVARRSPVAAARAAATRSRRRRPLHPLGLPSSLAASVAVRLPA